MTPQAWDAVFRPRGLGVSSCVVLFLLIYRIQRYNYFRIKRTRLRHFMLFYYSQTMQSLFFLTHNTSVMAINYRVYDYDTSTGLTILPLSPRFSLATA